MPFSVADLGTNHCSFILFSLLDTFLFQVQRAYLTTFAGEGSELEMGSWELIVDKPIARDDYMSGRVFTSAAVAAASTASPVDLAPAAAPHASSAAAQRRFVAPASAVAAEESSRSVKGTRM